MTRTHLSPAVITVGKIIFCLISALTLFWMVGKSTQIFEQRAAHPRVVNGQTIDFDVFNQAGKMFERGEALCLYDRACLETVQREAGFSNGLMSWNYPPVIALVLKPLNALEPRTIYFGLLVVNLAIALMLGYKVAGPVGMAMSLAYEPVAATLVLGQTSILMALMLWVGLEAMKHRPALSGTTLAMLIFKPHLAWVVPVALLARRPWQQSLVIAGFGALVTATLLGISAFLWPGMEAWSGFFKGLGQATTALANHQFPWQQMPTLYVSAAALGIPHTGALTIHLAGLSLTAAMLYHAWRTRSPADSIALTLIAAGLASPYLYHYDLVAAGLGTALYLKTRAWTLQTAAIAFLALTTPLVGMIQNDVGALLDDNAWKIQPMGPMLLTLFILVWIDAKPQEHQTDV